MTDMYTPDRRWLRFSLRRLMSLTTIPCLYFACWIPTITAGVDDVARRYSWKYNGHAAANAAAVMPCLLRVNVVRTQGARVPLVIISEDAYCFWLFGAMSEVPYTSRVTLVQKSAPKAQLGIPVQSPAPAGGSGGRLE
jgi:hypothetical protein